MSVAESVLVFAVDGKHLHLAKRFRRETHYTGVALRVKRNCFTVCSGWQPKLRSWFFCGKNHNLAVTDAMRATGVFDFANDLVGSLVVDPHDDLDLR